ncbi:MAG: 5,10-methylenetetrahydrofolate reductase [Saccharospirillaceae bacterium]|nr:hypothetical protein [Pseudomonadales bacterium]NRB80476.1 5,10-methylenetetrahydrofolate reductase [Saccharospirillaceae bacterium]
MLKTKIKNKQSGLILYGITPPKKGTTVEKIVEISKAQIDRLKDLDIDGLVLYDIADEVSRTQVERPFPFMETLDCFEYSEQYLKTLDVSKIIYRSVGKYDDKSLTRFVNDSATGDYLSVFVGASSKDQKVSLSIKEAYDLKNNLDSDLILGGVTISERHQKYHKEHLNVFRKMQNGCEFFVSQGVYDVTASKNFLSDYYYYGKENNIELAPIFFTLTPCGSAKTLEFMKWLGINIPRWLENELINSSDILQKSVDFCEQAWLELKAFADEKNIPIGCNIESVAIRKVEIDASIELLKRIQKSNRNA